MHCNLLIVICPIALVSKTSFAFFSYILMFEATAAVILPASVLATELAKRYGKFKISPTAESQKAQRNQLLQSARLSNTEIVLALFWHPPLHSSVTSSSRHDEQRCVRFQQPKATEVGVKSWQRQCYKGKQCIPAKGGPGVGQ